MKDRLFRLRKKLAEVDLDAILISNFYNILYLTGFKGLSPEEREAWVLITKDKVYLMTDGRYFNQETRNKIQETKLITPQKNIFQILKEIINEEKIKTIGFEADDLRVTEYQKFKKKLTVQFVSTEKLVLTLRAIKDDDEIEKIKRACELADRCFAQIIKTIKIGQTEREISWKIESWLKTRNSDLAFDPIVAIAANSALPHYNVKASGQTKVKKGSIILIDFGASYQDYMSDMTRILFIKPQGSEILKIYDVLARAQQQAINELKKTNDAKKIDFTARKFIIDNKLADHSHSTGHGLGLEIHELPKISAKSNDKISRGQVFTIEPGVYIEGKFGIRVEDTVWMKDDYFPIVLTKTTKEPIII